MRTGNKTLEEKQRICHRCGGSYTINAKRSKICHDCNLQYKHNQK